MLGQPPRPDGTARVRRVGRCGITRRLRDRPRLVRNVPHNTRSRRRLEIARVARPATGGLRRQPGRKTRPRRVLGSRTGARRRRSGSPAEHAVAARRQVRRAVDGRHAGTRRRHELGAFVAASEQLVAARPVLVAGDAGRRTTVPDAWGTARVSSVRRETRVVGVRAERALRPTVTPSSTAKRDVWNGRSLYFFKFTYDSNNATRHRASTSMYSLTFCVRVMSPERHHWKSAVSAAAVMLRTPPVDCQSPASQPRALAIYGAQF